MSTSASISFHPNRGRRVTLFFDGSNFIIPCVREKWTVDTTLLDLCYHAITVEGTIHRVYVYTTKSKLENFEAINLGFFNGCQIIYGFETTDPQSGKISREKGVDSLLVADLIYHSAMKNCEIALVGARDNDYMYALRRAQDFGVSVGLFNIVETPTKELIDAADPLFRFQISATQLAGN